MSVKLAALIKRTQAAIDAETDPVKLRPLQANLAAFLATKAEMDDDGDDDDDGDKKKDDDDGDDESKAKKAAAAAEKAKRKAEASKHRARAAEFKKKAAEAEEEAKKSEEDDEESEEEAAAQVARAEADAAAVSRASADILATRVAALEKREQEAERATLIADALGKRITASQAKALAREPLAYVRKFIEMCPKSLGILTDQNELVQPKHVDPNSEEALTPERKSLIEGAVRAMPGDRAAKDKLRTELVKAHIEDQKKQQLPVNGAGRV